jgi:hypothetical protein
MSEFGYERTARLKAAATKPCCRCKKNASGLAPETACDLRYKRGKSPGQLPTLWMAHSRRGRERALGYKESRRVRYEHAKNQERSFGVQNAPQGDSGNQFRRRRTHRTEGEILRGKGDRYDLEWPRGLHNAPAFPAGPRSGGIIVGIRCDGVSGRSAHARAERQLERD